jgi:outer membrane biosynthesis protein TonB
MTALLRGLAASIVLLLLAGGALLLLRGEPDQVGLGPTETPSPGITQPPTTAAPTTEPTQIPTQPTQRPTQPPTEPTEAPTEPTEVPTVPTERPTPPPTEPPTERPTEPQPTEVPTTEPSGEGPRDPNLGGEDQQDADSSGELPHTGGAVSILGIVLLAVAVLLWRR